MSKLNQRLPGAMARAVTTALLAGTILWPPAGRGEGPQAVAIPAPTQLAQAGRRVTFTDAQAERGRTAYTAACQDCHGKNLDDGEFGGAPIRGSYFESKYGGLPAAALFLYLSTTMPPDRPGQLSASSYADITAYLLQRNGYQAGAQDLPSTVEALDQLIMDK